VGFAGYGALASKAQVTYPNIRTFAQRQMQGKLRFTSEHLISAEDFYVGWLDLMGAGHIMSTSVQKAANFLARLHMSVEIARQDSGYAILTLPINDGIFILSKRKSEFIAVLQHAMALLATRFIATPRPHDRCLMRGAIAYGPVYQGRDLVNGISLRKLRVNPGFLDRVYFGPPIIQAYKSESVTPPFGIAIHESARAFSPAGETPFRLTHWLWWQVHDEAKLAKGDTAWSNKRYNFSMETIFETILCVRVWRMNFDNGCGPLR